KRGSGDDPNSRQATRQESFSGALVRALIGTMSFLFRAPVRIFRPVKLSSWTILEAMAKREGRTLGPRYLRSILRRERSSFLPHLLLPPLLVNTAIGFTLFEAYSITESRLLSRQATRKAERDVSEGGESQRAQSEKDQWTPLWIVTVAGSVAGAAQCFLSAPLDNVRYVLQQNVGAGGESRSGGNRSAGASIGHKISWRAVARAAILPFAPAIARERLVEGVKRDVAGSKGKLGFMRVMKNCLSPAFKSASDDTAKKFADRKEQQPSSKEIREMWEARIKRWRGGVHGSGLMLSLARDSVGFGSFFFIFECSRRMAYYTSISIDKASAWINGRGLGVIQLPSSALGTPSEIRNSQPTSLDVITSSSIEDSEAPFWERQREVDKSYGTSRTVQGRIVAVFILLVGGAIGALSYELVGRPFELMRIVIWEGRKEWEEGKREKKKPFKRESSDQSKSRDFRPSKSNGSTYSSSLAGRSAIKGARNISSSKISINTRLGGPKRQENLLDLRRFNTAGTRATRIEGRRSLTQPRHPLRPRTWLDQKRGGPLMHASPQLEIERTARGPSPTRARHKNRLRAPLRTPSPSASGPSRKFPKATLATRPGALQLLIEHARLTYKYDRRRTGDASTLAKDPSVLSLLVHTYFIAPFLPVIVDALPSDTKGKSTFVEIKSTHSGDVIPKDEIDGVQAPRHHEKNDGVKALSLKRALIPEMLVKNRWTKLNPVNQSFLSPGKLPSKLGSKKNAEGGVLQRLRSSLRSDGMGGLTGRNAMEAIKNGARHWGQGRVVWTLKRLATPYGVAFLVFAWMGGDL
ncbi:hypothetical protein IE53DRAFT_305912, partial [Violaceomyces palustris]